jgi:hypothetical protein
MTFSAMTIVTVTFTLMGGLLFGLGRIRQTLIKDMAQHQASLAGLENSA